MSNLGTPARRSIKVSAQENPMMKAILALTFSTAALLGSAPPESGFVDKTIDYNGAPVKYVVFVPKAYDPEKPHPTILFLHGSGEQGNDGKKQAGQGLGNAIKLAEDKWNFLVIFPQKPSG